MCTRCLKNVRLLVMNSCRQGVGRACVSGHRPPPQVLLGNLFSNGSNVLPVKWESLCVCWGFYLKDDGLVFSLSLQHSLPWGNHIRVQDYEFYGTSLMVQWLRIFLAIQGTWVQSLVGEKISHAMEQLGPHIVIPEPSCSGAGAEAHVPWLESPRTATEAPLCLNYLTQSNKEMHFKKKRLLIWKYTHSPSLIPNHPLADFMPPLPVKCWCSVLPSPVWPLPICLDSWT